MALSETWEINIYQIVRIHWTRWGGSRFLESRFKLLAGRRRTLWFFSEGRSRCAESQFVLRTHFPSRAFFSTSGHFQSPFCRWRLFPRFSRKTQSSLKAGSRWSPEIASEVQLVADENYLRLDRNSELRRMKIYLNFDDCRWRRWNACLSGYSDK